MCGKERVQLLGVHRRVGRPRGPQAGLGAGVACPLQSDQGLDIHHRLSTSQHRIRVAGDGRPVEDAAPSEVFVEECRLRWGGGVTGGMHARERIIGHYRGVAPL